MPAPRLASLIGGSAFLCLSLALVGCGGGPAKTNVSGTVTYGDKVVKMGQVNIWGADGVVAADINPDGTYLAKGVAAGEATVSVVSTSPAMDERGGGGRKLPDGIKQDPAEKKADAKDWIAIHADYSSPATSGLKFTVGTGEQKHDVKMAKK